MTTHLEIKNPGKYVWINNISGLILGIKASQKGQFVEHTTYCKVELQS